MSYLSITPYIFTREGSIFFKNKIVEQERLIPSQNINQLNVNLSDLIFKKENMEVSIADGGMDSGGQHIIFNDNQLDTYKTYLSDVKNLINLLQTRLNALNTGQGIRHKNKSRKNKRKSMRYMKNKRKSGKYKRY